MCHVHVTCTRKVKIPICPNMSFVKDILPFIRIWQLFGVTPLAVNKQYSYHIQVSQFHKNYGIAVCLLQIIAVIGSIGIANHFIDWSVPSLILYIDLTLLYSGYVLTLIILAESLVKRNNQLLFFQKISEIDTIFAKIFGPSQRSIRRPVTFDHFLFSLALILLIIFVLTLSRHNKMIFYSFTYMLPFVWNSIKYLQFIAFVRLVKVRCETMQKCFVRMILTEGTDSIKNKQAKKHAFSAKISALDSNIRQVLVYQEIILLRKIYHTIWDASILINKCFHFTMPLYIGINFCYLVAYLYWIFLAITDAKNGFAGVSLIPILCGAESFRRIAGISSICHHTIEEVIFNKSAYLDSSLH